MVLEEEQKRDFHKIKGVSQKKEDDLSCFLHLLEKNIKKYDYFQFLFKDVCKELLRKKRI